MRLHQKIVRAGAAAGLVAAATSALAAPSATAAANGANGAATDSGWALSQNFAIAVGPSSATLTAAPGCNLGPNVQHVVYVGFDNFHLRRDNNQTVANNGDDNRNADLSIPSDLEQVPSLYNFLRGTTAAAGATDYAHGSNTTYTDTTPFAGGTILGNDHTPLISHTSVDFTSAYTGQYGDMNGIATTQNNIAAYNGTAYSAPSTLSVGSNSNGGFGFWTDPLNIPAGNTTPQYVTKNSSSAAVNAPAPWVPFTRAGCDVGSVAATTMVLENQNSVNDVNAVTPGAPFTTADEGLSVHCASSGTPNTPGGICALASTDTTIKAAPDNLPAEPGAPYGGATGYYALYGHRFIAPAVNDRLNNTTTGPGSTTLSLLRSPSTTLFPGFNGEDGNYTLGYVLDMQKAGIPVTFGYLTTAHNCYAALDGGSTTAGWSPSGYDDYAVGGTKPATNLCNHTDVSGTTDSSTSSAFASGEQGYVNYLHQLNVDFQSFFDQAKTAGLTTSNTVFVFYSDENDHLAQATPANPTCDGVTTPCQYNHSATQTVPNTPGQMGEVTVKLDNEFPQGGSTSYFSLSDSAPDFYVEEQGQTIPSQSDPNVRSLERSLAGATYTNPYDGTTNNLARYITDQAGMNALHMITADPNRSPTFDVFAPGEDFVEYAGSFNGSDCGGTGNPGVLNTCTNGGFTGVHGDFAPETTTTWAGFVGPGVTNSFAGGVDSADWTDHTDMRPTLLALTGLTDDYQGEGRVITQILNTGVVNSTLSTNGPQLAAMLKQLNAPNNGATEAFDAQTPSAIAASGFGPAVLKSDTEAIESNAAGDATYTDVTNRINTITAQRNSVVADIQAQLANAQAGGTWNTSQANSDLANGQCLLTYARALIPYAAGTGPAPTDCNIAVTGVPEVPHSALLVVSAGVLVAGGLLMSGRRRRRRGRVTP